MNDERTGAERMTDTQRPDERVEITATWLTREQVERWKLRISCPECELTDDVELPRSLRNHITDTIARAERAEADVARLREALEWYADRNNYTDEDYPYSVGGWAFDPGVGEWWDPDQGERARAALSAGDDDEENTP